jgi:hypothetical protein
MVCTMRKITGYLIVALGLAASFTYGVILGVAVINPYFS